MANGLLAPMPNIANPQQGAADLQEQMARQQGMMTGTQRGGGMTPGMQPQQGYMDPGSINELYGILAQGTQDPQALGQGYARTMQNQQQQDRANQPIEKYMQLYGKVNPHDYSPKSINEFHNHFVRTGEIRHDLLQERERLSSTEEKALLSSYEDLQKSGNMIGNIGNLVGRFNQAEQSGAYTTGLYGSLDAWYKANVSGEQSDMDLLKGNYNQLKNEAVIQNLPPGVASDKDISIAREGWPPANANPAYIAAFLRGLQKMQVIKYAESMHRNNYISANQNMRYMAQDWAGKADNYILQSLGANGLQVNAIDTGETPAEYARRMRTGGRSERVGATPELAPAGTPGKYSGLTDEQLNEQLDAEIDAMLQ